MSRRNGQLHHLQSTYGLAEDDYEAMAEIQEYTCAICYQPETKKRDDGTEQPLSVDHDHETGRVRGLLCHRCNVALGLFRDDVESLKRAVEYLGGSFRDG